MNRNPTTASNYKSHCAYAYAVIRLKYSTRLPNGNRFGYTLREMYTTREPHRYSTALVFFFCSHASVVFGNVCDLFARHRSLLAVDIRLWTTNNDGYNSTKNSNNNNSHTVEFYSFSLTI